MVENQTPPPVPRPGGGNLAKARDPVLICILNLFLGGAGYLVLGQKIKGIMTIALCLILLFPPSCGTLSGVVAAIAAVDGYLQAEQLQQGNAIGPWTFFHNHL
ncbi:MAG: hypothetical protein ACXW3E_06305 [Thermoanaerobaculia bacterium]